MAAHFDLAWLSIERFYHFVCKDDHSTMELMDECKRLVLARIDDPHARVDPDDVSETTGVGVGLQPEKRIRRTAEEKLRIVEATLVPGASIARVAREHGVNANQVFQWRYEYRKGILPPRAKQATPELLPVTLTAEPSSAIVPEVTASASPSGLIHIELPGRALMSVESGVDHTLVRVVLESLLR